MTTTRSTMGMRGSGRSAGQVPASGAPPGVLGHGNRLRAGLAPLPPRDGQLCAALGEPGFAAPVEAANSGNGTG
ncbi:hypothetical protein [Streptomyces collinus]|uniref:hypothetical protein n=1 Tax=Streptomyces collinus TaxID=42684 RepID=UPI00362EB2EF